MPGTLRSSAEEADCTSLILHWFLPQRERATPWVDHRLGCYTCGGIRWKGNKKEEGQGYWPLLSWRPTLFIPPKSVSLWKSTCWKEMISWTTQVLGHICGPKFLDIVLPRRPKVKSGWVQTSNSPPLWLVRLGSISEKSQGSYPSFTSIGVWVPEELWLPGSNTTKIQVQTCRGNHMPNPLRWKEFSMWRSAHQTSTLRYWATASGHAFNSQWVASMISFPLDPLREVPRATCTRDKARVRFQGLIS